MPDARVHVIGHVHNQRAAVKKPGAPVDTTKLQVQIVIVNQIEWKLLADLSGKIARPRRIFPIRC